MRYGPIKRNEKWIRYRNLVKHVMRKIYRTVIKQFCNMIVTMCSSHTVIWVTCCRFQEL